MEQDVLSPTVQHGSETDFRSQMPGSGGDFLQGPGDRSEQDIKRRVWLPRARAFNSCGRVKTTWK